MADPKTAPKPSTKPATGNGEGKVDKPEESKAQRFIRLANQRVPKVVKGIRNVGNLALRSQYEYTPDQSAKLVKLLQDEVDAVKQRFTAPTAAASVDKIF